MLSGIFVLDIAPHNNAIFVVVVVAFWIRICFNGIDAILLAGAW